jgi:dCMP deaminase
MDTTTEKWDRRFLELARHISTWSKDPSTKVGAVIADEKNTVVGLGFNGFPRDVKDSENRYNDRETKYKFVVHAEANAVLSAGKYAEGCTIFVFPSFSFPPVCQDCAKLVIQTGIRRIVGYVPNENDPRVKRWLKSTSIAKLMCEEAGVYWESYKELNPSIVEELK